MDFFTSKELVVLGDALDVFVQHLLDKPTAYFQRNGDLETLSIAWESQVKISTRLNGGEAPEWLAGRGRSVQLKIAQVEGSGYLPRAREDLYDVFNEHSLKHYCPILPISVQGDEKSG